MFVSNAKKVFKFICSRIKTLSQYEENILQLREEMANLTNKKMAIEDDVTLAKLEGKTPHPQEYEWLMKVYRVEDDVRSLLEMFDEYGDDRGSKMMQCWTVAKKLNLLQELSSTHCEKSSPLKSVVEITVLRFLGLGAASHMKHILEILNKDEISKISVSGMGEIGKTSLIKNLNNELRVSSPNYFDIVIWVQVSRSSDLNTIQSQIAKRINLKVEAGDTSNSIASRILQRLKIRRKILQILDDVWEKIDLDDVGIPSMDPFCKILLTTRSRGVCRNMAVDVSFRLNLMSEEDAWNLFAESVGPVVHLDGIESLARKLAASCHGLPLAIKTLQINSKLKEIRK